MEEYPSGLRDLPTKQADRVNGAWVRIPLPPPHV